VGRQGARDHCDDRSRMTVRADASLARLTTLRLGGPARRLVTADSEDALVEAVREVDPEGGPTMLLAGGSNVVVADDGYDGTVVHVTSRGVREEDAGAGVVHVRVAAGEPWDDLVAHCVAEGLAGIECLAGIPGSTGATPIQNVGAYGQDVAETVVAVRAYDRVAREIVELPAADCGFTYRHSRFKGDDRFAILAVTFALRRDPQGGVARYAELARTLGVEPGARVPLAEAREAVLGLRAGKGMVLDPADHDTWSAGSFFTNPILDAAGFAVLADRAGEDGVPPRYDEPDGRVKTSAAWLIERAGFARGHTHASGRVSLSTKHTLALTNRGGATTADLLGLAREVRDGVHARFGVTLVPEPVLVGVRL
jgi:UDP-N-acetylmuramate dehydrogenase